MGSTRFIRALIEIGYLDEFYNTKEYKALQTAIVKISEELKDKVFGKDEEIQSSQWLKKTQSIEYRWLFSFTTIRNKIFKDAGVVPLHINKEEA